MADEVTVDAMASGVTFCSAASKRSPKDETVALSAFRAIALLVCSKSVLVSDFV